MAQPPESEQVTARKDGTKRKAQGATLQQTIVRRVARSADGAGPQIARTRVDGWNRDRKERFLAALRETCNVYESVARVGMAASGLYALRRRDPQFAEAWAQALEESYAELEMLLLRQALHGTERIERSDDGKGGERVKTVKSHPHGMAIRLLLAHRQSVDAFRAEQGIDRPGSDAVKERILTGIAQARSRITQSEGDGGEAR